MARAAMPAVYIDLDEAQDYFDWRINSGAWDEATNDYRSRALVSASEIISRLNFAGVRTSDLGRNGTLSPDPVASGQALEFPRNGETAIPPAIQKACCEIAYSLLDGADPEMEEAALATTSHQFAQAGASYDPGAARMAARHGVPSRAAWALLYPYLSDPLEFVLRRVN